MRRFWELTKNILIILLIGSLLLLTVAALPTRYARSIPWLSTLVQPIAPLLGLPQAELAYVETDLPVMDAAQPIAISVRNSTGRASMMWDFQSLDNSFDTLGGALGQALDTAESFEPVSQEQLQQALSGSSVYYAYSAELPARLLASWLDASIPEDAPVATACALALKETSVFLYLIGEQSYIAATGVQAASLSTLLEQYRPDGSQFAYEAGYDLSPLSLIPGQTASVPSAVVSIPNDTRFVEQLATNLGFNPYGDTRYTDTAGVTYFTEANCALQITSDGKLLLTSTASDRFQASGTTPEALVEEARRLVELAFGDTPGDARLYLCALTQDDGITQCTFTYTLSGIPVELSSGAAVTVSFLGSSVTQMSASILSFQQTAATLNLLPAAQASAILPENTPLALQYHVSGTTLTAGWALN